MLARIQRCFDHHNHFSLYLTLSMCPSLADVHDRATALRVIAALPADRPNLVTGWHSGRYDLSPADLDGLPPVAVVNWCLHGYMMNAAAAGQAHEAGFPVVPASPMEAERLMPNVLTYFGGFCRPDAAARASFIDGMRAVGIGGMEDMLYIPSEGADADAGFEVRRWMMPDAWLAAGGKNPAGFRGFKLFADGAVGSKTAALSRGTVGGWCPVLTHSSDEMRERIGWCLLNAPELAIHAIGDMAIQQVLDAVESVSTMPGMPADAGRRVRLEHVQFITFRQAMQAREMGVTLSMQPNFSEDSATYADRLTSEALAANNPFRMLIDEAGFVPGRDMIFGSDGMPHGLAAAVQNALFPPLPSQALSLDELTAGYSCGQAPGCVTLDIDPGHKMVSIVSGGE